VSTRPSRAPGRVSGRDPRSQARLRPRAPVPSPSAAGRGAGILLTTWQDFGAGSIQSVQYLAEGLQSRGHRVLVACPACGVLGRRLLARGVPVVDFVFEKGWSLRSAQRLAGLVASRGIDVVDAQESRDRKAAVLARRLLGMPARLVITRRQMSSSFPLENAAYGMAADRVIAISRGVAKTLWGVPERKITIVHDGLDPDRVAGDVAPAVLDALRARLGLDPALPTVGVVARRKDQETLLRAVAKMQRPVNVAFVGIERDPRLAALEPALPAGSRVAYTGFRDDVLAYWRLLDVKVLATRAEGLSQAILEAMGLGIPVVTAAVGGTTEVVHDGENGLVFPVRDACALATSLAQLLDDPGLARRFAEAGRATVAGPFHKDVMVRRTEAVYTELLHS
jgi:glycosyltransferase involved in cell wall biosynthesis